MRFDSKRFIGSLLLISGGISFLLACFIGWSILAGLDPMGGGWVRFVGWVAAIGTYLAMCVAGVLITFRSQVVPWLPMVLAVQIPVLEVGRFSYAIISFPRLEWGLLQLFGPTFSTTARMAIAFDQRDRPFQLSVNVIALAFLVWILGYFRSNRDQQANQPLNPTVAKSAPAG